MAASGDDRQPVAAPITTPQSRSRCHSSVIAIVAAEPAAIAASAATVTLRSPKRSISAAENGAIAPKRTRFIPIASEIWLTPHPNSSPSGVIITVGAARTPAATSSTTNAAPEDHPGGMDAPARHPGMRHLACSGSVKWRIGASCQRGRGAARVS